MSEKRSNKKFLLGITVALIIPVICYILAKELSDGTVKLPRRYVAETVANGDTVFHQVGDLVLTNQLGQRVSLASDLKGRIVVVNFIFTNCPNVCPTLTGNMKLLQKSFKKDSKKQTSLDTVVHLISITVDPERDSFPALRAYADRFGANHDHWWFLTGDKKTIYDFARNELQLPVGPGTGGADDLVHSERLVLIDKDRYVRGYYNGMDEKEAKQCADDIVLLTLERKHKK